MLGVVPESHQVQHQSQENKIEGICLEQPTFSWNFLNTLLEQTFYKNFILVTEVLITLNDGISCMSQ